MGKDIKQKLSKKTKYHVLNCPIPFQNRVVTKYCNNRSMNGHWTSLSVTQENNKKLPF